MITQEDIATQDMKERHEYQMVILDIRAVLATTSGRNLFKYLIKNLEVNELPALGMEGSLLMDKMGFLRAGRSVYDLLATAEPDLAASILAQITKEKNV